LCARGARHAASRGYSTQALDHKIGIHFCPTTPSITSMPNDPPADFDFIIGDWQVRHRRLNSRLAECTEWTEFLGTSSTRKILGGMGNVEDNVLYFPQGQVRAAAFRSFDPVSHSWSIWWLDGRVPHSIDVPVVGALVAGVGPFYADDIFEGHAIKVRFTWNPNPGGNPLWEQAFSGDSGSTWETNWTMDFQRNAV
jgi:hypothetical protein